MAETCGKAEIDGSRWGSMSSAGPLPLRQGRFFFVSFSSSSRAVEVRPQNCVEIEWRYEVPWSHFLLSWECQLLHGLGDVGGGGHVGARLCSALAWIGLLRLIANCRVEPC